MRNLYGDYLPVDTKHQSSVDSDGCELCSPYSALFSQSVSALGLRFLA